MNWKPSIMKVVISIILAILAGALYQQSRYVTNVGLAGFILGFIVVFIMTYIVYSLIQK